MSKKKKQREFNMRKAFASEFGIEGILMGAIYRANVIAGRIKQMKALKKSEKFKEQAKELRNG